MTRTDLFAGATASEVVTTLLSHFRELVVDRVIAERAAGSGVRAAYGCPMH
ncbi:hypothetical protein BH20ACT6_BH20ACT6_21470 [soil metagenome]